MDFMAEEDWTTRVMEQPRWQQWTLRLKRTGLPVWWDNHGGSNRLYGWRGQDYPSDGTTTVAAMDLTAEEDWTTRVMGQPWWQQRTLQNQQPQNGSPRQGQWPHNSSHRQEQWPQNGSHRQGQRHQNGSHWQGQWPHNGIHRQGVMLSQCLRPEDTATYAVSVRPEDKKYNATYTVTVSGQKTVLCYLCCHNVRPDNSVVPLLLSWCQTRRQCYLCCHNVRPDNSVVPLLSWCQTRRQCYLCCHNVRPDNSVVPLLLSWCQTRRQCCLCCHSVRPEDVLLMLSQCQIRWQCNLWCQTRRQCCLCCHKVRPDNNVVLLTLSRCQTRQQCCATYAVTMSDQTTMLCYLCCHNVRPDNNVVLLTLSRCQTRRQCCLCCHSVWLEDIATYAVTMSDQQGECSALSWEEPTTCC